MIKNVGFIFTVLIFQCFISFAQNVTVSGDIAGLQDPQIKISYYQGTVSKVDSVKVTDGKFKWVASLPEAQKVGIMFARRYFPFYAESGTIRITGKADSLGNLKVTGSKLHDESEAFNRSMKDLDDEQNKLYQKYGKVSKEEQLALETTLKDIRQQKRERANKYIAEHPKSPFSISLISDRATMGDYKDIKAVYDKLDKSAQQTAQGKLIAERLEVLKRSAIGEQMLDFTQNNTEGTPVKFADFKGKYVLVDFWASWCGPCRAENPNVLKAYDRYKDKGFTVVGVSLDDKEENWKKAIKEDNMPWTQLSDLKGWKNEVSTYYGIRGIPSTLLVDPNGKIIAKDLRGELLNQKLAELFN